jgi:glutamine amidotransferase PdxT
MSSDERRYRRLTVDCMWGGHIYQVPTIEVAAEAESLGAVRVIGIDDLNTQALSIPVICQESQRDWLKKAIQDSARSESKNHPDCYILREAAVDPDGLPSFLAINSNTEDEFLSAMRHDPFLLLCSNGDIVRSVREKLELRSLLLPVYLDVPNAKAGQMAYADGIPIDGLLIRSMPSHADRDELEEKQLESLNKLAEKPHQQYVIGVVSVQGDYALHIHELREAVSTCGQANNVSVIPVYGGEQATRADALVLPGGWSNTQGNRMQRANILTALQDHHEAKKPILAVCAGMILARSQDGRDCENRLRLGLIPVRIDNNVINMTYAVAGHKDTKVFSNAPVALPMSGEEFPPLVINLTHVVDGPYRNSVVGLRYENVTAYAFHEGIHQEFVETCLVAWDPPLQGTGG